jgi:hypothetical protein
MFSLALVSVASLLSLEPAVSSSPASAASLARLDSIAFDPGAFLDLSIGGPMPRDFLVLDTKGLQLVSRSTDGDGAFYIFEDPADPSSHATFLLTEGRVTGTIDAPGGFRTFLTSVEAGFSRLDYYQADLDLPCGCEARHLTVNPDGFGGGVAGGPCDNGLKVDVLVVYTQAAVNQAGSANALLDSINWGISDSNAIYAGSGIALQARLVGTALMSGYTENADMGVDLDRLTNPSDGFMDNVHALRDSTRADLVALVRADGGGACGVAWLLGSNSSAEDEDGFSVTALGCFSNRTFTHEMGHNMGCCHAPGDGGGCTSGGVFSYSTGHRFFGTDGLEYRTVMAYAPGTRIPRFSSPWITWSGTATGIAGQRDNARTINETKLAFGNFRCSADGVGNCGTTGENCYSTHAAPGCGVISCCEAVCAQDSYCCLTQWDALCVEAAIELCTTCGESAAGSCFEAHSSPSCANGDCCAIVCAIDPFCCNSQWDSICVNGANVNCPTCGDPETGSCYVGKEDPYCNNGACCQTVCALDPFCCNQQWDSICAATAIQACPGCGNPTAGTCYSAHATPFCEDQTCCQTICASDPFCCNTEWDFICAGSAVNSCAGCGNPTGASCLEVHATPYCQDATCCNTVCDLDSFCCSAQWDAICVNSALANCVQTCGGSLAGSCCVAHGNTHCDDAACCAAVCAVDASCCTTQWDAQCASAAASLCSTCPPANDTCDGATPLGVVTNYSYSTERATGATPACTNGGSSFVYNDIWFAYTPNAYGTCTVSTCGGADYDTKIAVFSGTCGALNLVACNDDACNPRSSLTFETLCGYKYYLCIGGFAAPSRGSGYLTISQTGSCVPPNDSCGAAVSIEPGTVPISNLGATGMVVSPACADPHREVWFRYRPESTGPCALSTCNQANFDTVIAVFRGGCGAAGLVEVACNDDSSGCALTSVVTFNALCNEEYLIAVGSYIQAGPGSGLLTLTQLGPNCCVGDLNSDGLVNAADLTTLLSAWGGSNPVADLNGDGLVNALDIAALLGNWGSCD